MAIVKDNIVTEGLSGQPGGRIVFRKVGNKTIVVTKAEGQSREPSEAQKKHKRRFQGASAYARKATQNPMLKEAYASRAKEGQSGYNMAVADFLNAPEIDTVDLSAYSSAKGSQLSIRVTDDHLVSEVTVAIRDKKGALLEQGEAQPQENGIDWLYTNQKAYTTLSGFKLVIRASDLPGNKVEKETLIP